MPKENISITDKNVNSIFLPELITSLIQVGSSAFCRQIGSNIKSAMDLNVGVLKYVTQNGDPIKALTSGYLPRFANNFVSMTPASEIGRITKERYPNNRYQAMIFSSLWESIVGSALEVKALRGVFKAAKVDISSFYSKAFKSGYAAIIIPNFFRNFCGWYGAYTVIGNKDDIKIGHRAFAGFCAGLLSAIPDTIGNRAVRNAAKDLSADNSLQIGLRALKKTVIDSVKNPLEFSKTASKGMLPRAVPSIVSAVVFSKEGGDAILGLVKVIANNNEVTKKIPNPTVSKAAIKQASERNKNR